jgi:hypothetical protein
MSTDAPRLTPVIIGGVRAGFLISLGPRGVEAYDRDERLIGTFSSAIEAAAAVEKATAPSCPGCSE